MTKTVLPGPYNLTKGKTSGPHPLFYPSQQVTKVSVNVLIKDVKDENDLDFFGLQVTFSEYPWSAEWAHGGVQFWGSSLYRINWGGLVGTDRSDGYVDDNPFDIDKIQNTIPQFIDEDGLNQKKFNANNTLVYTVERSGAVDFLPGYYTPIQDRKAYYVNHTRRMWRWGFTVSSTDGSFKPITQYFYTSSPYITQTTFWDENFQTNYGNSKWTDFTYETDTDRVSNVIVSSSTIKADEYFQNVESSGGKVTSGKNINSGSLTVGSGGYIVNNNVSSALTYVSSGGTFENNIISKGANVIVSAGGVAVSDKIKGGQITVLSGGDATWEEVSSGGRIVAQSGGLLNGLTVSSGGKVEAQSGSIIEKMTVAQGANVSIASNVQIRGVITNFGQISGGILRQTETVYSGAVHRNVLISGDYGAADEFASYVSARVIVQSGGAVRDATVDEFGELTVQSGGVISGSILLKHDGKVIIGPSAGGVIQLDGADSKGLTISGLTSGGVVTTRIKGFPGTDTSRPDRVELLGVKPSDVRSVSYPTADQVQLMLKSGRSIVMNIDGVRSVGYRLADSPQNGLLYETCFVKGSKIRLGSGEKAVESIEIGDEVVTLCPESQTYRTVPVIWVGRKRMVVDASRPEDQAGYPVRIVKDALGAGLPREDLVVTPEHCLYLNGGFVPARMLVNHRSIFYDRTLTDYDYFHIETAEHSILMANDVLTESYLDTGNRSTFEEQGNVVSLRSGVGSWEQDAAAPLLVEREAVEPLYREFEARAHVLGCVDHRGDDESLTTDPDLRLLTNDGTILSRKRSLNGRELFLIPQGTQSVQILSRTSRPSEVIGPFVDDRRELGVLIGAMDFFHAAGTDRITGHHTAADLWGWAELESASYRWTQGAAMLPITPEDLKQGGLLSIQVIAAGPYLTSREDNSPNPSVKIA
ncbi:Hint domain-containing protein [Swingsia samuiensis]|uniref:Hedgehog/Intein (Hint) domain-containing protein n=1 Tax=Swingsia samuiensis TaxID=1293412 RepID=A0A4Y6UJS0_9PROT|nr:Hint domain-containing protein [Swingsia samuiensis]QDH16641.1 hypothetical protein E3D00_02925 [Swingsia samuiensis]